MAATIAPSFIEELLSRIDIAEIIGERIALKKSGQNLTGLCPFHNEKSPSFTVSRKKQFYHCFGCGAHGDAIRFLMEFDHLTFPQAVEMLAVRLGLTVEHQQNEQTEIHSQRQIKHQTGYAVLAKAALWFQQQLLSPNAQIARNYLNQQRALSGPIQQQFGLGYAPAQWQALNEYLQTQGFDEQIQAEYGLLSFNETKKRYFDRFRQRVIFPIYDWQGRVIAFGGRLLSDGKPKYLNSSETPLFHKGRELFGLYQARRQCVKLEKLIIVEGYIDVLTLAQYGFPATVATLGTALTSEHLHRLFNLVDQLVFCFDGDKAGQQAAARALSVVLPLMSEKRQVRFLFLPEQEDPDSFLHHQGAKAFNQLLACASPLSEYIFVLSRPANTLSNVELREQFITQTMQYILQLPDGLLKTLMLQELALRSKVPLQYLEHFHKKGVNKAQSEEVYLPQSARFVAHTTPSPSLRTGGRSKRPVSVTLSLACRVLHLLMHTPALIDYLPKEQQWCPNDVEGQLLVEVINLLRAGQYQSAQVVLAHFFGSPKGQLLTQLAQQEMVIPADKQIIEIQSLVTALKQQQQMLPPEEEFRRLIGRSQQGELLTKHDKNRLRDLITLLHSYKT